MPPVPLRIVRRLMRAMISSLAGVFLGGEIYRGKAQGAQAGARPHEIVGWVSGAFAPRNPPAVALTWWVTRASPANPPYGLPVNLRQLRMGGLDGLCGRHALHRL